MYGVCIHSRRKYGDQWEFLNFTTLPWSSIVAVENQQLALQSFDV